MEKIGNDRLFIRFNIMTIKGNKLGIPSLEKDRRGLGDLEIFLD